MMGKRQISKVEVHSHVLTPAMLGAAGSYGPEMIDKGANKKSLRCGSYESAPFLVKDNTVEGARNPAVRAAEMDELGIDVMGVTISPIFYCYGADRADGRRYASICNDEMNRYCEGAAGRFFFLPTLPLQDIGSSLQELQRLQSGSWARGLNMSTDNIAGRDLHDEALWPIYEYCEDRDIALFLHPAAVGTDDPRWSEEDNRKDIFNFGWIAGYIYRESLAFGNLVLGGVLDRFPKLKVCLPHGGGFVPYQLGRFEEAAARMPASRAKKPVSEYIRNFHLENSVHDERARNFLVDIWGLDNIYCGSNYEGWDQNDAFGFAETMVDNPDDLRKLWADNARQLFHIGDEFGRAE